MNKYFTRTHCTVSMSESNPRPKSQTPRTLVKTHRQAGRLQPPKKKRYISPWLCFGSAISDNKQSMYDVQCRMVFDVTIVNFRDDTSYEQGEQNGPGQHVP